MQGLAAVKILYLFLSGCAALSVKANLRSASTSAHLAASASASDSSAMKPEENAVMTWFAQSPPASAGLAAFLALACSFGLWQHSRSQKTAAEEAPLVNTEASQQDSQDKSIIAVLGCALLWMSMSSLMTLYNAYMFSETGVNFPYVIFLTCWHMFLNTCLAVTVRLFFPSMMPAAVAMEQPLSTVLPTVALPAFLLTCTLVLGNKSYLFLSVSLIQMVKAAMPMATYLIGCTLGMETMTASMLGVAMTIIVASTMTITGEISYSLIGVALMLGSFVCEGCRLVSLKRIVSGHGINLDPLSGLLFYAPLCFSMLFCLLFATGEAWNVPLSNLPVLHLLANGAIAVSLNVAGVYLLRGTSSTTMAVCGVVKDMAVVVVSIPIFHNMVTVSQVLGFSITVAAVHVYNALKSDADYVKKVVASFQEDVGMLKRSKK